MRRNGKTSKESGGHSSKAETPRGWNLRHHTPFLLALVIAAIPFAYGKYIEFNMHGAFDSGLNVYHAKCIVDGQKIGESVFPSARPATLLLNVIGVSLFGYSEFGPKCIQMLCQLAALIFMYFTLRKVYGPFPAAVALVLAAFFLSCPPFAKYGNVKEQFMVAFMIISACALMWRHLGGRWWWLVLSGGTAVNIYFFKPTGVSVILAIMVYLLVLPLIRRRPWSLLGSDVAGFLLGVVVGFIPLTIFYVMQDQFLALLRSFPGAKEMSLLFQSSSATSTGSTDGYVQASRSVSTFATQFDAVMRYYRMLIVPIGFGVLAIGAGVVGWAGGFFSKSKKSVESDQNESCQRNFLLLFAIWWILDMLFIWISPRNYVQYYLPLMASAAMLAAYGVFRCQRNPVVILWLIGVWLVLDVVLVWLVPSGTIVFLGLRSGGPEHYWSNWAIQLIPLAIAVSVYFFAKGLRRSTRTIVVALACGYALLCWSGGNMRAFEKRVGDLQKQKAMNQVNVWEQMGQVINKNSKPDDGLYVWGWYPGIYVAAQRFCPATQPSYSDMHTDSPERVSGKIQKLVKQLAKKPPTFIVDSQKKHYPYHTHPNFQLWPALAEAKKKAGFVNLELYQKNRGQITGQVEAFTFQMLRHPKRPGGVVQEEKAHDMAKIEKRRHEAMEPLREFVMKNYRPAVPAGSPMILFRYQPVDVEGSN